MIGRLDIQVHKLCILFGFWQSAYWMCWQVGRQHIKDCRWRIPPPLFPLHLIDEIWGFPPLNIDFLTPDWISPTPPLPWIGWDWDSRPAPEWHIGNENFGSTPLSSPRPRLAWDWHIGSLSSYSLGVGGWVSESYSDTPYTAKILYRVEEGDFLGFFASTGRDLGDSDSF